MIKECHKRVDTPVDVVIGKPIPRSEIDVRRGDAKGLMDFLRESTYALSPKPLKFAGYGFEFEEKYKSKKEHPGRLG